MFKNFHQLMTNALVQCWLSVYSSTLKYFGAGLLNIDSGQQGLRQANK